MAGSVPPAASRSSSDRTSRVDDARRRPWSIPIGRVAGVQIRVHATLAVLLVLVAWSAAAVGEDAVGAVAWLILLFGCVVLHELAHSLVARARGVDVHEIDLLPIGGISRMDHVPERWADELVIAAAGPLASVGLALLAATGALLLGIDLVPVSAWSGAIVTRLVWMNLLLAAFNLVPAFPSDGGRILRALLERDRPRDVATRQAAHVGRAVASVLIGVGLFWNVWLLVIGVFIWWAGRAEESAVVVHEVLGPVPVAALAVPCPVTLPGAAAVGAVTPALDASPQVAYPTLGPDGELVGVAPLAALRAARADVSVSSLAVDAWIAADAAVEEAGPALERHGLVGVRPAEGSDGVVGVLTATVVGDYLRDRLSSPRTIRGAQR